MFLWFCKWGNMLRLFWVSLTLRGKSRDLTCWGVLLIIVDEINVMLYFLFLLHHFHPYVYKFLTLQRGIRLRVTIFFNLIHNGCIDKVPKLCWNFWKTNQDIVYFPFWSWPLIPFPPEHLIPWLPTHLVSLRSIRIQQPVPLLESTTWGITFPSSSFFLHHSY